MRQTILQWFEAAFPGFDPNQVNDAQGLLATQFDSVRLNGLPYPSTPELNGNLQCTCGGDVLVTWTPKEGFRGRVLLIHDDSGGEDWQSEQTIAQLAGRSSPTRPRPFARLRLLYII